MFISIEAGTYSEQRYHEKVRDQNVEDMAKQYFTVDSCKVPKDISATDMPPRWGWGVLVGHSGYRHFAPTEHL